MNSTVAALLGKTDRKYPWQVLSNTTLKWVAVITMLIDHIGAILVWSYYLQARRTVGIDAAAVYDVYNVLREIGRIAFPIFCFVLVEGFVHTHSKPRYALRLFIFALISEIPYDLAFHDSVAYVNQNGILQGIGYGYTHQLNVIFTLLLGFLALWAAEALGKYLKLPNWATFVLTILTLAIGVGLAERCDVSYHGYGIILIGVMYLARNYRVIQFILEGLATVVYCVFTSGTWLQMYALVGFALLFFYNGKRGRGMKYFFYIFYPAHLLILAIMNILIF